MVSVVLNVLAVFGLLEVGDTILDPFGKDPEDFAVLHFVECTAVASLEATQVDASPPHTLPLPSPRHHSLAAPSHSNSASFAHRWTPWPRATPRA